MYWKVERGRHSFFRSLRTQYSDSWVILRKTSGCSPYRKPRFLKRVCGQQYRTTHWSHYGKLKRRSQQSRASLSLKSLFVWSWKHQDPVPKVSTSSRTASFHRNCNDSVPRTLLSVCSTGTSVCFFSSWDLPLARQSYRKGEFAEQGSRYAYDRALRERGYRLC